MKNIRQFTSKEILNSKGYVKGFANYPAPNEFLKDLLNIEEEKYNITLQSTHEIINRNEDETENVSFGRVDLGYKFKVDEDLSYKIGLVFALDKGKPIAKVYTGLQVHACLNMCVFNADQVIRFDLSSNFYTFLDSFKSEFKKVEEKVKKGQQIIKMLKSVQFSAEKCKYLNGAILQQIIENNSVAGIVPITNAIKLQTDKSNKYNSENGLNAWQYYNSLTEYLDKKVHVLDIPEKALDLFQCLKNEINLKDESLNQTNLLDSIKEIEIVK